jgi:archaellum component FlaD/FlaE
MSLMAENKQRLSGTNEETKSELYAIRWLCILVSNWGMETNASQVNFD